MKTHQVKAFIWSVLSLVVLAGLVAGCGGGSDEGEQQLSKAEYIKQADAICEKTESRQGALLKEVSKEPLNGEQGRVVVVRKAGLPPLRQQVDELKALPDPDADAAAIQGFIHEFQSAIKKVEGEPLLVMTSKPFAKAEALATKAGFKVCGGP